jgi:hypothetical protein
MDQANLHIMEDQTRATALTAAAPASSGGRWAPPWIAALARLAGPVTGGILALVLALPNGTPLETSGLTVLALLTGALIVGREPGWTHLLPFMGALARAAGALLGGALLVTLEAARVLPGLGPGDVAAVVLTSVVVSLAGGMAARRALAGSKIIRIAVIGGVRSTDSLGRELRLAEVDRYEIVGRITWADDPSDQSAAEVPLLGSLEELGKVAERHGIDLLLMTGEPPRMASSRRSPAPACTCRCACASCRASTRRRSATSPSPRSTPPGSSGSSTPSTAPRRCRASARSTSSSPPSPASSRCRCWPCWR